MPHLQLRNHQTNKVIYEGHFATARACAEHAVKSGICLDYADLRHANLAHAALDDAVMRHARLDGANLTGANLSEAQLDGTSFANATLHAACFCLSSLVGCNFEGSLFGATDITGSILHLCRFSTLSAFSLNFIDAAVLTDCRFYDSGGQICPFSKPPVLLHGLDMPVIFMDGHLKIGGLSKSYREWLCYTNDNLPPDRSLGSRSYTFFRKHHTLFECIREKLAIPEEAAAAGFARTVHN